MLRWVPVSSSLYVLPCVVQTRTRYGPSAGRSKRNRPSGPVRNTWYQSSVDDAREANRCILDGSALVVSDHSGCVSARHELDYDWRERIRVLDRRGQVTSRSHCEASSPRRYSEKSGMPLVVCDCPTRDPPIVPRRRNLVVRRAGEHVCRDQPRPFNGLAGPIPHEDMQGPPRAEHDRPEVLLETTRSELPGRRSQHDRDGRLGPSCGTARSRFLVGVGTSPRTGPFASDRASGFSVASRVT